MPIFKVILTETRTAELFVSGTNETDAGKQAINGAESGALNWALFDGKKEYAARVQKVTDCISESQTRDLRRYLDENENLSPDFP